MTSEFCDRLEIQQESLDVRERDIGGKGDASRAERLTDRLRQEVDDTARDLFVTRWRLVTDHALGQETTHALRRADPKRLRHLERPHRLAQETHRGPQIPGEAVDAE